MFVKEDWEKLNSIWDGKISNGSEVCGACKGLCCHNTDKTLFPGEYDFLVEKTGQHNSLWRSSGCLCMTLKTDFKPVICKLFPLTINITLVGDVTVSEEVPESDYTTNCSKLVLSKENVKQINKWLKFLFSDLHNRLFYLIALEAPNLMDEEREIIKKLGKDPDELGDKEIFERALYKTLQLPIKEQFTHFDFNLKK